MDLRESQASFTEVVRGGKPEIGDPHKVVSPVFPQSAQQPASSSPDGRSVYSPSG